MTAWWRPSPRRWSIALAVALGSRAVLLVVSWFAAWLLAKTYGTFSLELFDLWERFDAEFYLAIADCGYVATCSPAHPFAMFPLYPLAIALVRVLGLPGVVAAMAVSGIATVIALRYLHELAETTTGEGTGPVAVLLMAFFPTGFFLVAPYTEALFLAGATAAFVYARRGEWTKASLGAAVAAATKILGVFVIASLVIEALIKRTPSSKARLVLFAAAGSVPLILFGLYTWSVTGSPLTYLHDQEAGWGRKFSSPLESLTTTLSMIELQAYPTRWMAAVYGELLAVMLIAATVAWCVRRREWGFAIYSGASLAVVVTSTYYYSVPRIALALFPVCLFITDVVRKSEVSRQWAIIVSASLCSVGTIAYTQGIWFY